MLCSIMKLKCILKQNFFLLYIYLSFKNFAMYDYFDAFLYFKKDEIIENAIIL